MFWIYIKEQIPPCSHFDHTLLPGQRRGSSRNFSYERKRMRVISLFSSTTVNPYDLMVRTLSCRNGGPIVVESRALVDLAMKGYLNQMRLIITGEQSWPHCLLVYRYCLEWNVPTTSMILSVSPALPNQARTAGIVLHEYNSISSKYFTTTTLVTPKQEGWINNYAWCSTVMGGYWLFSVVLTVRGWSLVAQILLCENYSTTSVSLGTRCKIAE